MKSENISFNIYNYNCNIPNPSGDSEYIVRKTDLVIPKGTIEYGPEYLEDLYNLVGPTNIFLTYYLSVSGYVTQHECFATHMLNSNMEFIDGSTSNSVIAKTPNEPTKPENINPIWNRITRNSNLLKSIKTYSSCFGDGCKCKFEGFGGWDKVRISLKIDVEVNFLKFCTTDSNVYHDSCYYYLGNKIATSGGPTYDITQYLQRYCRNKYPDQDLSMFNDPTQVDPKDYQLCACNMSSDKYKLFSDKSTPLLM